MVLSRARKEVIEMNTNNCAKTADAIAYIVSTATTLDSMERAIQSILRNVECYPTRIAHEIAVEIVTRASLCPEMNIRDYACGVLMGYLITLVTAVDDNE